MMTLGEISRERVKKHAEIFTPAGTVFEMITQAGMRKNLQAVDNTMFDPAVGQGQFPCAELVWKMFYNIDKLDEELALRALQSLYAMDIQHDNVIKTREHLIATICDAYKFFTGNDFTRIDDAFYIVFDNIVCGDSLEFMRKQTQPQLELF